MRILVCGSRGWTLREPILEQLIWFEGDVTVIHGAAHGADTIGGEIAAELGFEIIACPPEWHRYGKAAGPIRNKQMLTEHEPDLVLAFVRDWSRSPGTRHMVSIAKKAGVETRVFDESGPLCSEEL